MSAMYTGPTYMYVRTKRSEIGSDTGENDRVRRSVRKSTDWSAAFAMLFPSNTVMIVSQRMRGSGTLCCKNTRFSRRIMMLWNTECYWPSTKRNYRDYQKFRWVTGSNQDSRTITADTTIASRGSFLYNIQYHCSSIYRLHF